MRWILLALIFLLVVVHYHLWFGDGGLIELRRLATQAEVEIAENVRLRERNLVLEREVEALRTDNEALEERARNELGLVRPGETFYQIVEPRANR
ncbi:MAG: cell division protein FtsB [Chromatiales bacterium]|nr:cell division protein FtsB [Chromatiales bacterium]